MDGENQLQRGLSQRHISLMALGAAIGVGLFLGSATAIKFAGPAILIVYALAGMAVFFIMRALGEMAVENPVSGSFCHYAHEHIGPLWLGGLTVCYYLKRRRADKAQDTHVMTMPAQGTD